MYPFNLQKEILKMEKQKRISFGYIRNDINEIVIYKEQAEVVKLIFELYSFDQSLAKISKHLEIYPTTKICGADKS